MQGEGDAEFAEGRDMVRIVLEEYPVVGDSLVEFFLVQEALGQIVMKSRGLGPLAERPGEAGNGPFVIFSFKQGAAEIVQGVQIGRFNGERLAVLEEGLVGTALAFEFTAKVVEREPVVMRDVDGMVQEGLGIVPIADLAPGGEGAGKQKHDGASCRQPSGEAAAGHDFVCPPGEGYEKAD